MTTYPHKHAWGAEPVVQTLLSPWRAATRLLKIKCAIRKFESSFEAAAIEPPLIGCCEAWAKLADLTAELVVNGLDEDEAANFTSISRLVVMFLMRRVFSPCEAAVGNCVSPRPKV